MKKLLALVVTLVLVMSMATAASAAEYPAKVLLMPASGTLRAAI